MRIMKIAEDVPRHAGDLCPIDHRPVCRQQMSNCGGEHYALYCEVCQTFWPEDAHRSALATDQQRARK